MYRSSNGAWYQHSQNVHSENFHVIKKKVNEKAIKYSEIEGKLFTGGAGRFSWLFSFHDFFFDADALDAFSTEFWNVYRNDAPLQIGGLETSAIPLIVAVIQKAKVLEIEAYGFFIRKERKTGGLARLIDGNLNESPIILLDDVYKSGATMERSRVVLESIGKTISRVCTIVGFQRQGGHEWAANHNVDVDCFFHPKGFDLEEPKEFLQDPSDRRSAASITYEPVWHFAAPDPIPTNVLPKSTPLLIDDKLYFGSDSGVFWALDALTGSVVWEFDAKVYGDKGIWSSPAYSKGLIYFGAYNGNIYCLNSSNGEIVWINPACDWVGSSPLVVPCHNILIIGLEYAREKWKGGVAAFDVRSGEKIWEHQLHLLQHGSAAFSEVNDLVICGSSDHAVLALDPKNGRVVWKYKTERSIKYPPLICDERNIVATTSHDGHIRILSIHSGELKFEFRTNNICYSTPLIVDNRMFCSSSDGCLYVIDLDTYKLIKTIQTKGRIFASPDLIDGNVIFGNTAGVLEEININTLSTESAVIFPDCITNKVAISKDESTIFVPTYRCEIYALKRIRENS